jgi:hypothetical protein
MQAVSRHVCVSLCNSVLVVTLLVSHVLYHFQEPLVIRKLYHGTLKYRSSYLFKDQKSYVMRNQS